MPDDAQKKVFKAIDNQDTPIAKAMRGKPVKVSDKAIGEVAKVRRDYRLKYEK